MAHAMVRDKKINLGVQEPPDATSLMGFVPAQEADKHECKKHPVRDTSDKNVDFGCRRVRDLA